jgi:hypothetical protein
LWCWSCCGEMTGREEYGGLFALIVFEWYWSMIGGMVAGLDREEPVTKSFECAVVDVVTRACLVQGPRQWQRLLYSVGAVSLP